MWYTLLKISISAILIGIISEVSQRSSFIGGILASIPLTSFLAFIWLYVDTKDTQAVADLSSSIFWLVVPSLSFFVVFPLFLKRFSFTGSMLLSTGVMLAAYYATVFILGKFGVQL